MYTYLTIKKQQVAVIDKGQGSTIIMLHGFMENATIWDSFQQELSNHYRVVAVDLPGHGQTAMFSDVHSMTFMAEIVKDVLGALSIKECIIIAHSMGGYVALAFAREYSSLLKGLVLFHSHSLDDTEEQKQNRIRSVELIKQDKAGFISSFVPSLFDKENVSKHIEQIEQLTSLSKQMLPEGIIAAQLGMKDRGSTEDVLQQILVPVLSILGKQDIRMPYENLVIQASFPNHAEILVLDNCGHMGFIEQKGKTLKAISCFVCRCYK